MSCTVYHRVEGGLSCTLYRLTQIFIKLFCSGLALLLGELCSHLGHSHGLWFPYSPPQTCTDLCELGSPLPVTVSPFADATNPLMCPAKLPAFTAPHCNT